MDPSLERSTLDAEDRHWWYRGRQRVVMDAARRRIRAGTTPRILDAGCGGGATLVDLAALGPASGLEPSPLSREKALARSVADVVDGRLEALPFADASFDLMLVLDVIEHLDDPALALRELRRVVAPGGAGIVTVPAHPRLWSRHDERNHHRRRYTRESLTTTARAGGWRVERITHFMTALLPLAILARAAGNEGFDVPPRPVNRALQGTIEAEAALIRRGASFPAGLSLLAELSR